MTFPPAPTTPIKIVHHVVPASWQRKFGVSGTPGPFYRNVITGKCLGSEGPGKKMAEEYANVVFDKFYRISNVLEDHLGTIENRTIPSLQRTISTSVMDPAARVDIAYLLSVQVTRYPERYQTHLDQGRYFGISLIDFPNKYANAAAVNAALKVTFPGAAITQRDFETLKAMPQTSLAAELNSLLDLHGYEEDFNPRSVIDAASIAAEHLLALKWELIESPTTAFILSDRPVPYKINYGYSVGLSARFGLKITKPLGPVDELAIPARPAIGNEVAEINTEVRSRAREWICGPDNSVWSL